MNNQTKHWIKEIKITIGKGIYGDYLVIVADMHERKSEMVDHAWIFF